MNGIKFILMLVMLQTYLEINCIVLHLLLQSLFPNLDDWMEEGYGECWYRAILWLRRNKCQNSQHESLLIISEKQSEFA